MKETVRRLLGLRLGSLVKLPHHQHKGEKKEEEKRRIGRKERERQEAGED